MTLNFFVPSSADTTIFNGAFFSRDTGDTHWPADGDGLFDGNFDFGVTVTNDDAETLGSLLFEDDTDDLFYVLDTDSDPCIDEGVDAFRIAEVGEGWADKGSMQSAAAVDAFIGNNGLALLGVGETTLTEHGELV